MKENDTYKPIIKAADKYGIELFRCTDSSMTVQPCDIIGSDLIATYFIEVKIVRTVNMRMEPNWKDYSVTQMRWLKIIGDTTYAWSIALEIHERTKETVAYVLKKGPNGMPPEVYRRVPLGQYPDIDFRQVEKTCPNYMLTIPC